MNKILEELLKLSKFKEYVENIKHKNSPITISGLSDVGKIEFIAGTYEASKKPICIVTYNEILAKRIIKDLEYFVDKVGYFPKREIVAYDFVAESKDLPYERIELLNKIKNNESKIVVTTAEALMQRMITPNELYKNKIQ